MAWRALIFVFIGGALGSLARETLGPELPTGRVWLPTLLINLAACFVLGWLYAVRDRVHEHALHLGAVGFCGGLSTFSHFALEVGRLIERGALAEAAFYAIVAAIAGIVVAALGEAVGRRAHGARDR